MACYNSNNYRGNRGNRSKGSWYGKTRNYESKRKTKYTKAENIAFRLGQEQRVKKSITSGKTDSRVYEAYCKGFNGVPNKSEKKSLY